MFRLVPSGLQLTFRLQLRRIQLNMRNAAECRQIVHVFERRGMEFQEQKPRTARPGTARPSTDASKSRPLTLQSNSPYFASPAPTAARPSPFTLQSVEAGSLSQLRSPSPNPPSTRFTGSFEKSGAVSQEMPPPPLFRRDEASAPREAIPTRPTTAQIYRSYTTPSQASQYDEPETSAQPTALAHERPSSASQTTFLEAIRREVEEYNTPPQTTSNNALSAASGQPDRNENWSSGTVDPVNLALLSSDHSEPRSVTARPSTPATMFFTETLEHEIPPRRELPFPRPDSRRSASDKSSSRPATSALTLPPLPKPTPAKAGSKSSSKSNSASPTKDSSPPRPATTSPLKRSFVAYQDEPPRPDQALNTAGQNMPADGFPTKKPSSPFRTESQTTSTNKPSRMDELLARKKPLAGRSTNMSVPRLNSLADAPHEIESPPSTAKSPEKRTSPGHEFVSNAYAAIRSPTRHPEEASLEEYAAQSREDREATIDEFMVANLENPGFTKLCEDVENCWRRIALGL